MVSGVGRRELLSDLGIEIVADLPGVGQNMWVGWLFEPQITQSC